MKTIGLLGGLSWHSSLEYYRIINQAVQDRLGGAHSARCLLYSLDYAEVDALERQDRWDDTAAIVIAAAQSLERGGADFLVICTNTTHKLADRVQAGIGIPILHIADATARAVRECGIERVGLLGTRFTMEEDFVRGRLARSTGLDVMIPPEPQRELVNRVIYDELCAGVFRDEARRQFLDIMRGLVEAGAEGIILGCTEIGLLVPPDACPAPAFDTARVHALAAVDFALAE